MTRHLPRTFKVSGFGAEAVSALSRRVVGQWGAAPAAEAGEAVHGGLLSLFLSAASRVYEQGLNRDQARALRNRSKLPVPVISVGNLVAGGTGKTPLAVWLCRFLAANGFRPAILSRGYGGKRKAPARVFPEGDPAAASLLFGDEPVLMARALPGVPVWVGRDRFLSGRAALEDGRLDTFVLDDGFQHLKLHRDLDIVLLDCRNPFGNGHLLPRGPLREPASHLARADVLVLTRAQGEAEAEKAALRELFPGKPVFSCRHKICGLRPSAGGELAAMESIRGRRSLAFAGIAAPESFFGALERLGIDLCGKIPFPDHHRYAERDLLLIAARAARCGARLLLTTAKDAVRLPDSLRRMVAAVEMEIDFGADHDPFCEYVQRKTAPA